MADSLGEYKVVVTADYSQLQEQMKNISKLVSETANGMTNAMSNATSSLNANIAKAMDDMNANIAKAMGTMQSTLNKELKLDNIKVDTSGVEKGFNDTIKKMNEATDAARKFSNTVDGAGGGGGSSKVTDDFESYAKQIKQATKEAEKLHQEIQRLKSSLDSKSASKFSNLIPDIDTRVVEARLAETEKKFDDIRRKIDQLKQAQADYNNNINKTELAAKEVDKALQQQVRDKEKIDKQNAKMLEGEQKIAQEQQARIEKENEKRQRQINSLNNAYRRLYDNINSYVATNTQMTEKQFYRYQTALSALQAKMQSLGSFLPSHAIQNMSYASYHEPFKIADDNKKNQEAIRKLGEEYERVYRNINSYIETNTKMSARQFYTFNEGIQRLRESVIALGQTPDFKNPLANMNYAEYAKGFDTVSAAVTKANKQTGFFIDTLKSLKHHMTWMASGAVMMTAFAIPTAAVRSIAEVEKEMAGFRQVNHEANESQEVLNETSEKFINIAQRYGMSVDEIIKAGKRIAS